MLNRALIAASTASVLFICCLLYTEYDNPRLFAITLAMSVLLLVATATELRKRTGVLTADWPGVPSQAVTRVATALTAVFCVPVLVAGMLLLVHATGMAWSIYGLLVAAVIVYAVRFRIKADPVLRSNGL